MRSQNLTVVAPPIYPVTENITVWTVKVQCVLRKYCMGGRLVHPGEEHEMILGDAEWRESLGHLPC